jgi:hypothetical protein
MNMRVLSLVISCEQRALSPGKPGMLPAIPAQKGERMIFAALAHLLSLLIDLATCTWRSDREKDLEILLLRRQLAILQQTSTGRGSRSRRSPLPLTRSSPLRQSMSASSRAATSPARSPRRASTTKMA